MAIASFLKDVIVAVVSVVIAVLGYSAWRIQFVAKERYSLARQALLKAYQIKERISLVRAPIRYVDIDVLTNKLIQEPGKWAKIATMTEGASKAAEEQRKEVKKVREAHMNLYNERWKEVWSEGLTDLSIELRLIASETGVVIGQEVRQKLELLGQCLRDLQTARDNYFEVGKLLLSPAAALSDSMTAVYKVGLYERKIHKDLEVEKIKHARAVIHSTDQDDEFGKNLDSIVGAIESSLQPLLKLH